MSVCVHSVAFLFNSFKKAGRDDCLFAAHRPIPERGDPHGDPAAPRTQRERQINLGTKNSQATSLCRVGVAGVGGSVSPLQPRGCVHRCWVHALCINAGTCSALRACRPAAPIRRRSGVAGVPSVGVPAGGFQPHRLSPTASAKAIVPCQFHVARSLERVCCDHARTAFHLMFLECELVVPDDGGLQWSSDVISEAINGNQRFHQRSSQWSSVVIIA